MANEVEVNVPQQLRVGGKHTYSVTVTLRAKNEKSVTEPIFLVVQGTGIDKLQAHEPDGMTGDEEPYFLILPEIKKLSAASPSVSQKISFKSDGRLKSKSRRNFKLDYRLTRDISQRAGKSVDRNERRSRESRLAGVPRRSGAPSGSTGRKQLGRADDEPPGSQENGDGKNADKREPFTLKPEITQKEVQRVIGIQDKWTKKLMETKGVIGTATGLTLDGDIVIRVYTSRLGIDKDLPKNIEGIPVQAKVVGRFRASFPPPQDKRGRAGSLGPRGTRGVRGALLPIPEPPVESPQKFFPRPVPIGVSGIVDLPFCATGTIGRRLKAADGTLYALSNNHVFADENNSPIGALILQPGPLDANCSLVSDNSIGALAAFVRINFTPTGRNRVDAAVARVTAATLSNRTSKGAYGTPNSKTVAARLGMKVQKMGCTTSFTTGRVTAVNSAVLVGYTAGPGFFVNQIEITKPLTVVDSKTGNITVNFEPFGGPGDSGSLIVTTYGNNPVGLLFAGSVFVVIGNPIDAVLDAVSNELGQKVSIDGSQPN